MRNRSLSAASLLLWLGLCPAVAQGDLAASTVGAPASPLASAADVDGGVELLWSVIDRGGGISEFEGLVLTGAVAELNWDPFAILWEFDSPAPPGTGPTEEELLNTTSTELALASISPNPNRGTARLSWTLPSESRVRLSIHDLQGREVDVVADGSYPPGRHDVAWRAGHGGVEAAGIYFVRLQAGSRVLVRRMVMIR